MPPSSCSCGSGTCLTCACARGGRGCSSRCHGGGTNLQCCNIKLESGIDVQAMKATEVKMELIKRGLYNLDDTGPQMKATLLRSLASEEESNKKKKKKPAAAADDIDDDADDADDSDDSNSLDPVAIAKKILSVSSDDLAVLNVLLTFPRAATKTLQTKPFTAHTPASEVKKVYRFLAGQVHPDKLQRKFQDATKAFQALVSAYDRLSQGVVLNSLSSSNTRSGRSGGGGTPIDLTITRSNTNCFATPVYCPRCNVEWNQPCDGLEKIAFTIMMCGIQSFHCSTCLLEFGCITAVHRCPHCKSVKSVYEYTPDDFNRQISCGNTKGCGRTFGFTLTIIPPRRMKELTETIKSEQERRMAAQSTKDSRANRAKRRGDADDGGESEEEEVRPSKKARRAPARDRSVSPSPVKSTQPTKKLTAIEKSFVVGLLDACPRCGFTPQGRQDEFSLRSHLDGCNDKKAHSKYEAAQRAFHAAASAKAAKKAKEVDSQSTQVWKFLGATKETTWMLTDGAVKNQLQIAGVETSESTASNLAAFHSTIGVRRLRGADPAESSDAAGAATAVAVRSSTAVARADVASPSTSAASFPTNLHRFTKTQLIGILSSHDMLRGDEDGVTKDAILERINARREGRKEEEVEEEEQEKTTTNKTKTKEMEKLESATAAASSTAVTSSIVLPVDLDTSILSILGRPDFDSLTVNTIIGELAKLYSWSPAQVDQRKSLVKPIIKKHALNRMKE